MNSELVDMTPQVPTTLCEKVEHYLRDRTRYLHVQNEIPQEVTNELAMVNNYYVSVANPQDMRFTNPGETTVDYVCRIVYNFFLSLYVQAALLVPTLLFLLFIAVRTHHSPMFLLVYSTVIDIEVLSMWAYERGARFAARFWWELAWLIVGLIVTSIHALSPANVLCVLLLVVHWMFMARITVIQVSRALRVFCASERRCYIAEGVVLDMAYITRNVIAMGWPARGTEALYRNPWNEVVHFLRRKYARLSSHVITLCSERCTAPFPRQSTYPVDDHNPAEVPLMISFCCEVADYVMADPYRRAVAVHCKGGKGRTGTMICAYLMYCGQCRSADAAMRHFSLLRSRIGAQKLQGVQTPSQERYVRYFERLINEQPGMIIPSHPRRVRRLVLHNVPPLWVRRGVEHLWMTVIVKPCTERRVVYLTNRTVTFNAAVPDSRTYNWRTQIKDLFHNDEEVVYQEANEMDATESGCTGYLPDARSFRVMGAAGATLELAFPDEIPAVDGDVCFKFFYYKNNPNPLRPPVQFWIHTGLETHSTIRLERRDLDGAFKDTRGDRYPAEFAVELVLEDAPGGYTARE
ncbi:tyrosine phosphatase isoform [Leishmania donovani]|uniref:Tyrosine_phosphatase_isoform_putative/GeneDB:LmjF.34.1430 n=1 Tax=Leishmania donovani TaxID=5661 RepID=A0A6J8FQ29_LEIDO|nr:tyrosine phosphatase isoform [Leishmania donovani]VDZ48332.1 tyrosine_phosphatase_isoform_putative/GeneDB:LmjF.34.1430 [Leishmania donovani]